MSVQFGNTKIGAMQYNGVTIGKAMYNGKVVYTSAPPVVPFQLSGTITSRTLTRSVRQDLATSPNFSERGVFLIELGVTWATRNNSAQNISYTGYTISHPAEFGVVQIGRQHDLRYPPYNVKFQAFSNSAVTNERTITSGWWKITRVAM